jgi:hypothetical protein
VPLLNTNFLKRQCDRTLGLGRAHIGGLRRSAAVGCTCCVLCDTSLALPSRRLVGPLAVAVAAPPLCSMEEEGRWRSRGGGRGVGRGPTAPPRLLHAAAEGGAPAGASLRRLQVPAPTRGPPADAAAPWRPITTMDAALDGSGADGSLGAVPGPRERQWRCGA